MRTRRTLSLYKVYGDSTLLVLNKTSLDGVNALLALNRRHVHVRYGRLAETTGAGAATAIHCTCTLRALRCIYCAIERNNNGCPSDSAEGNLIHQFLRQDLLLFLTKICFHWLNRRRQRQFKEIGKILIAFSRVVSWIC